MVTISTKVYLFTILYDDVSLLRSFVTNNCKELMCCSIFYGCLAVSCEVYVGTVDVYM